MNKLYKNYITCCCILFLTSMGNTALVFSQERNSPMFNSSKVGVEVVQKLKGTGNQVPSQYIRKVLAELYLNENRSAGTQLDHFNGTFERSVGNDFASAKSTGFVENMAKKEAIPSTGRILDYANFSYLIDNSENQVVALKNHTIATTITTTWNGSSWDFGPPTAPNPPNVVISGNYTEVGFTCSDILIHPGYSFSPSSDIHVWGNCISNSTLTSGHLIFDSPNNSQSIVGTVDNLTLNNSMGGQLNGATFLKGTLKLQSGNLETNGYLTVVSNPVVTGRIATIESGASISGEVTVQRFIPGGLKGWYFLAPPVLGQVISNWNDGFIATPSTLFIHNEAGTMNVGDQVNGWEYPNGTAVTLGKGYRLYLPQSFFSSGATIDNKGLLKSGDHSFTVTYSPIGFGGGGWNLLGNPYACELDWHDFLKTNIGGSYHVWNKDKYGSYSQGVGIGVNDVERYITSHQAFFVKANSPLPTLSVTENSKPISPQNSGFLRISTSTDPPSVARITLKNSAGSKDETAIRWMEGTTVNFDEFFDANKFPHDGLLLYSLCNDGANTSIQARPFVDGESVDLGYAVKTEGTYSLTFNMASDLFENRTWFLRDNEFGMIFPIQNGYVHSFTVDDGILLSNWRFSIVGVNNPVANSLEITAPKVSFVPNPSNEILTIRNAFDIQKVSIFNINGKEVFSMKPQPTGEIKVPVGALTPGVYLVKAIGKTEILTHKLIID